MIINNIIIRINKKDIFRLKEKKILYLNSSNTFFVPLNQYVLVQCHEEL